MALYHTDHQALLAATVAPFLADEGGISSELRRWRHEGAEGFGWELWRRFAELGLTGMLVPEADGGLGMGHVEAGIVLAEIGRNLTPSPFLSTSVIATTALAAGSDEARGLWLPAIVAGEQVAALALDEGPKHRPERIACRASRSGNGFRLSGAKNFVVHGPVADVLIVAARTGGEDAEANGITLFAVPNAAAGVAHDPIRLLDGSVASHVRFDSVELDGAVVLGEVDGGRDLLDRVLAAGRCGAAAEQTGVAAGAMDRTIDYLKQRKQFGRYIGEFQALQHRAAHLYSEVEIARAAVLKAQQLLDTGSPRAELMVSAAKAKAGRACNLAVREGVQMHGGIGMTDEHDIGLFMKRDRALSEFLGDPNYHADRVARLYGY